jgi:hypothetical protein
MSKNIFCSLLAVIIIGASPYVYAQEESEIVSGTLLKEVADGFDENYSSDHYFLKDEDTKEVKELKFKNGKIPQVLQDAPAGSKLKFKGKQSLNHIEPDLKFVGKDLADDQMDVVTYPSSALKGTRKVLAVVVDFNDDTSACTNEATAYKHIFDTNYAYSARNLIRSSSNNLVDLLGETAKVKINVNSADITHCDSGTSTYQTWGNLTEAALKSAGYTTSSYQHVMYLFPRNYPCSWGGRGMLNNRITWIRNCHPIVLSHELGHNFGLHHANKDGEGEYSDHSCTMGRYQREFNAPHKQQLGWIPNEKTIDLTQDGTYKVAPLNEDPTQTNYAQVYRIHNSAIGQYYYLSFRDKSGTFDANLESTYADRLNITRYKGSGSNYTYFMNGLDVGGSHTFSNTTITVKNLSKTSSYIEFSVSGLGGGGSTSDTTAPTVSLTAPSNGSSYNAGSTVTASASASDNVGVTKVEFFVAGSLKCSDTTSPYSCSFAMPTGSSIAVMAKAHDAAGNSKSSTTSYISSNSVDTTAPTVSLTAPSNGSSFNAGSTVTASASASDNVGVTKVEFFVAGSLKCSDTTSPYSCSFAMPTGSSIAVMAKAHDAAGNSKNSTTSYISSNSVDTTAPSVSLTSPANGSKFDVGASVTAMASASDNVGVTKVEFFLNGSLKCSDSSSPYSCSFSMPAGSNLPLLARAHDAAGNTRDSSSISISSNSTTTADTEKPVVTFISPASGSEHAADSMVTLNFKATDNVGVVTLYCYGASGWQLISASATSCQVKMPASGEFNARVYARDAARNYIYADLPLKVKTSVVTDTEAPVIKITSPADGSEHAPSSVVKINFEATDNVGIQSLYCYTPAGWKSVPLTKPYSCEVQMPASGDLRTRVFAYDTSKNAGDSYLLLKEKQQVAVDTEKPVITITSPAEGSEHEAGSLVTLNFRATDNVGVTVLYCYGASGWQYISSSATSCQVKMPDSGDFVARVYARDAASNYEYANITLKEKTSGADIEKPEINIISPAAGSSHPADSLVTLNFEASDNVGIQRLYCYGADGWKLISSSAKSCQIKMPASGDFTASIYASDESANVTLARIDLKVQTDGGVDNVKPEIRILSPDEGSSHAAGSTVTIDFEASDNVGIQSIYCYSSDGWRRVSATDRSCQIKMPSSGDFRTRVWVYDTSKNYHYVYRTLRSN